MLKKTITYTDFDGNERTEDFYFNLTQAEVVEIEHSVNGGLSLTLQKITKNQDATKIVKLFKDIILKAYGEKSDDGRRFMKSKEITDNFIQTEAYSELYMELATDDEKAAEFINGILPAKLVQKTAASG
jgi:hypothetical protein